MSHAVPEPAKEIAALLCAFGSQPFANGRRLREAVEAEPARFLAAAVGAWQANRDARGRRYLVSLMAANDLLLDAFQDPRLSVAEAAVLAREAAAVDPMLDLQLARHVMDHVEDEATAARLLEVLEAVMDGPRVMPVLNPLLAHHNPWVRSKAALLIGKANRNARWAGRQMDAPDARVRANAIEALWGVDTDSSREVFWDALEDPASRVAGNAAVGLYLQGETRSVPALLNMACHPDPAFRASAAWCMGETLDPRFMTPLGTLLRDTDSRARQNALRAVSRIRQRLAQHAEVPPLRVAVLQATRIDPQSRRLVVSAAGSAWAGLKLLPTSFVISEGGWPAPDYEVRPLKTPDSLAFGFALPRLTDATDPLRCVVESALLACSSLRRRTDSWAVMKYTEGAEIGLDTDNPRLLMEAAALSAAITQPGPRQGGLADVLRRLMYSLIMARAGRHLVVIGDPSPMGVDGEKILLEAQTAGVAIHGIAPPVSHGDVLAAWCRATGGIFAHADHMPDMARLIECVCMGLMHRYQVVYRVEGAGQESALVRVDVHTTHESGKDECRV